VPFFLQSIFTSASAFLNEVTKGRVHFHKVVIVLPPQWNSVACGKIIFPLSYVSRSSVVDATLEIGGEHPIFGHTPWTQQSRGCRQPGDKISVGYQYIMEHNGTEMGAGVAGEYVFNVLFSFISLKCAFFCTR